MFVPRIAAIAIALLAAVVAVWALLSREPEPEPATPEPAEAPTITPYVGPTADRETEAAPQPRTERDDTAAQPRPESSVTALPVDDRVRREQRAMQDDARAELADQQARALASREFRIGIQSAMGGARADLLTCWEEAIAQGRTDDDRLVFDLVARADDERGVLELTSIDSSGLAADDLDCFAEVVSGLRIAPPDPLIADAEGRLAIRYPMTLTVED